MLRRNGGRACLLIPERTLWWPEMNESAHQGQNWKSTRRWEFKTVPGIHPVITPRLQVGIYIYQNLSSNNLCELSERNKRTRFVWGMPFPSSGAITIMIYPFVTPNLWPPSGESQLSSISEIPGKMSAAVRDMRPSYRHRK